MNGKKKKIIESAIKLFAKDGFHATSMQNIADEIGVAKGSLYLQFKSKEELLLSILEHYQNEMFESVSFVAKDTSLTQKENLIKQVYIQFSGFQKNGDFIKMQIKEQLNHDSDAVRRCMFKMRTRLLNWQKQALLNVQNVAL
jgi:AcrR family transcriptional regulator